MMFCLRHIHEDGHMTIHAQEESLHTIMVHNAAMNTFMMKIHSCIHMNTLMMKIHSYIHMSTLMMKIHSCIHMDTLMTRIHSCMFTIIFMTKMSTHTHDNNSHHEHHHTHAHTSYTQILEQIHTLPFPSSVKDSVAAVYRLIREAESKVHHSTLDQIHFHEVGSIDALVDVTGCAYLLSLLEPETILCSPVHVGNGFVHCAHGTLPVPAPATAELLKGIPFTVEIFRANSVRQRGLLF